MKQMKLMCLMRTLDVPGKLLEGLVSRFANYLFHTIFVEAQHACFKMKGSEARNIVRTYFMLLRMIGEANCAFGRTYICVDLEQE